MTPPDEETMSVVSDMTRELIEDGLLKGPIQTDGFYLLPASR